MNRMVSNNYPKGWSFPFWQRRKERWSRDVSKLFLQIRKNT